MATAAALLVDWVILTYLGQKKRKRNTRSGYDSGEQLLGTEAHRAH